MRNSTERRYLFDYADIIAWNDAGEQHLKTWDGHEFQGRHIDHLGNYDGGYGSGWECHINEVGCLRLGKAMWWLLARIAGWDGQPE